MNPVVATEDQSWELQTSFYLRSYVGVHLIISYVLSGWPSILTNTLLHIFTAVLGSVQLTSVCKEIKETNNEATINQVPFLFFSIVEMEQVKFG